MTANEIKRDHQRLLLNLKTIQKNHSVSELSGILGISVNTWTNRMKEPWRLFSYDDLRSISRHCRVDFMQLVDGEVKLR